MKKLLFICCALLMAGSALSQTTPKEKWAVFIVDGLSGPEQCRFVDTEMRKKDKVIISRMDIPTSRYLIRFYDDAPFNETWFSTQFLEWGLTIHCYSEGYEGLINAVTITKSTCPETK